MTSDNGEAEQRAVHLAKLGRSRAAIAVATAGLCRDPNDAGLWMTRAVLYHGQRRWRRALNDIEQAMTLAPLPAIGQIVLGDCYWFTGCRELALVAYEYLLGAEQESAQVYASAYAGFIRCGRRDLALKCCRAAVAADPEDHAAWFAMAHCMAALDYDASYVASVLSKAVGIAPDRDVYRLSLAIQNTRCGRCDEAYEQVKQVGVSAIATMTCACSVSQLLAVCLKVQDSERSAQLAQRLSEIHAAASKNDKGGAA